MKKPVGIIIILIMNSLKLLITLLPVIMLMVVTALPEGNEFRQGFEIGIGGSLDARTVGELMGRTAISIFAMIALYVIIYKRKYALTIGILVLQLLLALSAPVSLLWVAIMLLILLVSKKSKLYFQSM